MISIARLQSANRILRIYFTQRAFDLGFIFLNYNALSKMKVGKKTSNRWNAPVWRPLRARIALQQKGEHRIFVQQFSRKMFTSVVSGFFCRQGPISVMLNAYSKLIFNDKPVKSDKILYTVMIQSRDMRYVLKARIRYLSAALITGAIFITLSRNSKRPDANLKRRKRYLSNTLPLHCH